MTPLELSQIIDGVSKAMRPVLAEQNEQTIRAVVRDECRRLVNEMAENDIRDRVREVVRRKLFVTVEAL